MDRAQARKKAEALVAKMTIEERAGQLKMCIRDSGKTTLLNLLAALDKPTGGQIRLNGKNLGDLKEKEIAAFRRENLGFVFQDFNLLDTFSLKDNIFLPLVLEGKRYREDVYKRQDAGSSCGRCGFLLDPPGKRRI